MTNKAKEIMWTIFGGLFAIGVLYFVFYFLPMTMCSNRATQMDMSYSFGWMTGCMVKTRDGQWVPMGSYRVID